MCKHKAIFVLSPQNNYYFEVYNRCRGKVYNNNHNGDFYQIFNGRNNASSRILKGLEYLLAEFLRLVLFWHPKQTKVLQ